MRIGETRRYWNAEIVLRMREKGLTGASLGKIIAEKHGFNEQPVADQINAMMGMRWRPKAEGTHGRTGRVATAVALRREIVVQEVAKALEIPIESVCPEWLSRAPAFPTSRETVKDFTPQQLSGSVSFMLSLPSPKTSEQIMEANDAKSLLLEEIERLSPVKRKVLKMRFGLPDGHIYTLEETGRAIKKTRERVRQIESRAMRELAFSEQHRKLQKHMADR